MASSSGCDAPVKSDASGWWRAWQPFAKMATKPSTERVDPGPWWVSEKIHGAHFVILTNGEEVRFAKRGAVLQPGDTFFGFAILSDVLAISAQEAWRQLARTAPSLQFIAIHGELYGGAYPFPVHGKKATVTPLASSSVAAAGSRLVAPVQTGIWYSPAIQFQAFDVAVYNVGDTTAVWLDLAAMQSLLKPAGMPCVEPLFVGKRADALAFNIRFQSRVPALHGLPPLPTGSNMAEGVVLRPCSGARQLCKLKNKEFSEIVDEVEPSSAGPDLTPLVARINRNRFDAVRSKVGPDASADTLAALLLEDAAEDMFEDARLCSWYARLSPGDLLAAKAHVRTQVGCWLRTLLVQGLGAPGSVGP